MTREIRVTRGSSHHDPRVVFRLIRGLNPRIWLADTPYPNLLQLRAIAAQAPRGSDPRIRKKNTNLCASCLFRADAPVIRYHSVQNNHQVVSLATRTEAYSSVT